MADLISKAAALDALDHERKVLIEQERFGAEHIVVHHARRMIEELPAVDAIPVEWLEQRRFETSYNGYKPDIDLNHAFCTVMNEWQKEQEAHST